jgi:hypothetical protein
MAFGVLDELMSLLITKGVITETEVRDILVRLDNKWAEDDRAVVRESIELIRARLLSK